MGKMAFVYPGQGSQKVGMGKELVQSEPALFKKYLLQSDQVSGQRVSRLCLLGPGEVLSQTQIAQPALFAYSLALTDYAQRLGLFPDLVAGHSLGEYTAAVAAGALSFADGLGLVSRRGQLMKQAQDEQPGAMAAVLGLSKEALTPLCQAISRHDLVLVTNWNAPGQLVVSGTERGVERLMEAIRARGKGTAMRLPVKGAFHSPLMEMVQQEMAALTQEVPWQESRVPLVGNVAGSVLSSGEQIRQELVEQITSPVQWVACVQRLIAEGCDTFIELGSGQVLTKLVRLIAPQVRAVALDTPQQVASFVQTQRVPAQLEALRAA
jgi:[acyl-carrier-protein] S-malonyltransferase